MGQGKVGPFDMNVLGGYTYIDPIQTDFNAALDTAKNSSPKNVLKYRYRHTAKGDVELGYKKWSVGASCRYNSYMENIDRFFVEAIPGVKEYRGKNKNGDVVYDARLAWQMNKTAKLAFIVNNVFNREYIGRPADLQPPRSFALQLTVKI